MKDILTSDDVNLPKPENLSRAANHHHRQRPDDPVNLEFELQREFVGEEFVLDDIRVDGQRHIIFANQNQLHHLRQAKWWFIDGTFKLVKQPFHQLSTIHCSVKKRRRRETSPTGICPHVTQVIQSIRGRLGEPMVEWFMLDFEAGWHRRINGRAARANLAFYVLVPLFRGEAETVDLQIRLVSESLLTRTHRKKHANIHGRLFDAWDKYEDEEITTTQLLSTVSHISGLGPTPATADNDDE